MERKNTIKETLAWIVLAGAVFLFSVTLVFAQEKKSSTKGTTTIKIVKKEDGKTTKVDTTFDSRDDEAVEKILQELGIEHNTNFNFSVPAPPSAKGDRKRVMKYQVEGMSKEDREKLKEDMENLEEEMGELREKMKDIHIEIFSDKDGDDGEGFSYNFSMPPMPPIPPMNEKDFTFFDKDYKGKIRHPKFMFYNLDSLTDADHVAIVGDEDEQPPVFEKQVTGKNGEKIFIYKRIKPENKISKDESPEKSEINLYPNPNDGKFSLRFHSDNKSELMIRVYDAQGKEVYAEKIKEFKGDYSNQLDLSDKGKGNYILKITQGNKTMTEKFVIE